MTTAMLRRGTPTAALPVIVRRLGLVQAPTGALLILGTPATLAVDPALGEESFTTVAQPAHGYSVVTRSLIHFHGRGTIAGVAAMDKHGDLLAKTTITGARPETTIAALQHLLALPFLDDLLNDVSGLCLW